jgi:hypothetical protein
MPYYHLKHLRGKMLFGVFGIFSHLLTVAARIWECCGTREVVSAMVGRKR